MTVIIIIIIIMLFMEKKIAVYYKITVAAFPVLTCPFCEQNRSRNNGGEKKRKKRFQPSLWGIPEKIYLLLLKQGVKITALFLADNA